MIGIAGIVLRTLLQVLAGVGLARVSDKWLKPKVPATYYPEEISKGWGPFKIVAFAVCIVLGVMIMGFIGKKLNIKILKNPCKR